MPDLSPEDVQLLLGIHPSQQAANQALLASAQGPSTGENGEEDKQEQPNPRPLSTAQQPATPQPVTKNTGSPSFPRPLSGSVIKLPPRIAGPPTSSGEQPGEATPPPGQLPESAAPGVSSLGLLTAPRTARPITPDIARTEADQEKLDAMRKEGSGISRFQRRHGLLGPIVRGLEIAGTVVAPHVMEQVPGTTSNFNLRQAQQEGRVKEDLATQKEKSDISNKEEVTATRAQAEEDRRAHNKAMDELKAEAEQAKEAMRDITYNVKTGQFERGGAPYTPKDFQEGAILETQHGVPGRYTDMWLKEKRNQAPVTHIHNPSEGERIYQDWRDAFRAENSREPNAEEINNFRRGNKGAPAHVKDRQSFDEHWHNEFEKGGKDVDRQRQEVLKAYGADKDVKAYNDNKADIESKFADIQKNWAEKAAKMEAEKDAEAEQFGVYRGGAPAAAKQPSQQSQTPQTVTTPKTKQDVKIGQTVPVNRGGNITYHKVLSIDNGKVTLDPAEAGAP